MVEVTFGFLVVLFTNNHTEHKMMVWGVISNQLKNYSQSMSMEAMLIWKSMVLINYVTRMSHLGQLFQIKDPPKPLRTEQFVSWVSTWSSLICHLVHTDVMLNLFQHSPRCQPTYYTQRLPAEWLGWAATENQVWNQTPSLRDTGDPLEIR